jgi:S-formylglutathione hydrolase FrmB
MGGYGAMKWALREPGRFAAVASLSGALDMARGQTVGGPTDDPDRYDRIFGDQPVAGTGNDLMRLLDQADPATVPQLYVCCGTEDPLYEESLAFRDACHAAGIPLTADFGTGEHAWDYWDAKIQQVLSWLPLTGC